MLHFLNTELLNKRDMGDPSLSLQHVAGNPARLSQIPAHSAKLSSPLEGIARVRSSVFVVRAFFMFLEKRNAGELDLWAILGF